MLRAYSSDEQTIDSGENIILDVNSIQTGCTVTHTVGSPVVLLNRCGFYKISFSGVASAHKDDIVGVSLLVNGLPYAGAVQQETIPGNDDLVSISFVDIVQAVPNTCSNNSNIPTQILFENLNVTTTWTDVVVTATKIG